MGIDRRDRRGSIVARLGSQSDTKQRVDHQIGVRQCIAPRLDVSARVDETRARRGRRGMVDSSWRVFDDGHLSSGLMREAREYETVAAVATRAADHQQAGRGRPELERAAPGGLARALHQHRLVRGGGDRVGFEASY